MANTKHTPLDWVLRTSKSEVEIVGDYHSPDSIFEMPNTSKNYANAKLIVKAVNNHDKLVESLEGMVKAFDDYAEQAQFKSGIFMAKQLLQSLKD